MTSTRLTQQTRSREWAAALRAATHRPHRPLSATRGTAPTPDPTRPPVHPSSTIIGSASYETHSRTRVGGWVLRSGCADPFPARSCLGAPRPPKGGGPPPPPSGALLPRAAERARFAAPKARRRVRRARRNPASRSPANLSQAGRHESGRAPLLSPLDLIPPPLAPSWPLRWA